ncbi:MAG TPA: response regulator [Actinomycetota bacterium]|nr:response regulator [Actinomycetota bacterium]
MERVLVVDDEPDVLLLCRLNLEQQGFDVLEASNGRSALELLRDEKPDVLVLDLMMPGMTGYDVLEAIRADQRLPETPILVLTAKSLQADRVRTAELGASAFLTKPFLPSELCELVRSLVGTG